MPAASPFGEQHVTFDIGEDTRHIKFLHQGHRLAVDRRAANDKAFRLVGGAGRFNRLRKIATHDAARSLERRIARQHVIGAVREWPSDIVVILTAEHNRMPRRNRLESLEIGGQVPRQVSVASNDVILRNCNYCRNQHKTLRILNFEIRT